MQIISLQVTVDKETDKPTTKLSPSTVEWCKSVGSDSLTVEDILTKPDAKVS